MLTPNSAGPGRLGCGVVLGHNSVGGEVKKEVSTCGRCNRGLKDPVSKERGFGPICRAKVQADRTKEEAKQDQLLPGFDGNVVCTRENGWIATNIPRVITRHSPDGFEWGYGGSGPADFALNILAAFIGVERAQQNGLYQQFKWDFIATMPREGGVVKKADILAWLDKHDVGVGGVGPRGPAGDPGVEGGMYWKKHST